MTADNSGNSMSSPLGMTNVEVVDTVDTVGIEAALDEILQTVTNLFSFFFPSDGDLLTESRHPLPHHLLAHRHHDRDHHADARKMREHTVGRVKDYVAAETRRGGVK
jgi:hypothetical protein